MSRTANTYCTNMLHSVCIVTFIGGFSKCSNMLQVQAAVRHRLMFAASHTFRRKSVCHEKREQIFIHRWLIVRPAGWWPPPVQHSRRDESESEHFGKSPSTLLSTAPLGLICIAPHQWLTFNCPGNGRAKSSRSTCTQMPLTAADVLKCRSYEWSVPQRLL